MVQRDHRGFHYLFAGICAKLVQAGGQLKTWIEQRPVKGCSPADLPSYRTTESFRLEKTSQIPDPPHHAH